MTSERTEMDEYESYMQFWRENLPSCSPDVTGEDPVGQPSQPEFLGYADNGVTEVWVE